jgi:SPP1 gp7 family putative phage head morphogenesis protein
MTPKPPRFDLPRRIVKQYEAAMRKVARQAFAPHEPGQTLDQWLAAVAERSLEPDIEFASNQLAQRMVKWVNTVNARTWREAASRSQRSRFLYGLLKAEMQSPVGSRFSALVRENARYIRSVPVDAAQTLVGEVAKAQQQGVRPKTMAKALGNRFNQLVRSRVNLIARTETSKASAALTRSRAEYLDLPCYIWRTSEDARVRDSHRLMDGVVCFYSQPPAPELLANIESKLGHYHAGEAPNDRCTQIVVLSLDDLHFPLKVAWNNRIQAMNKQQFLRIAHNLEKRAA